MDYTTQSLAFKARKTLRYIRLYGIRRTLTKVKGQYHMKKRYAVLPVSASPPENGGHVGLIGCGNFAFSNIAYYLKKNYGQVIRGAMDIDIHHAVSLYKEYDLRYYTVNAEEVISDPAIDLFYIASNHASHAEYAIQALRAGKSVHIEKPHVVCEDQLRRLCSTMVQFGGKVNLGFNRPYSRIGRLIKRYLDMESGPTMFNWFIAGHEIAPDHWYFKEKEGGRVLGNLCHWTDFILRLVPPEHRYPITITPMRGHKSDCDIAVSYLFGDGSIAAITFSAKGHTFEGVRERFAAHRGNVLISMDDFKELYIEVIQKKHHPFQIYREHGHEECIKRGYGMVRPFKKCDNPGYSVRYVWETGDLFLKTKKALEVNSRIVVNGFDESCLHKNFLDRQFS